MNYAEMDLDGICLGIKRLGELTGASESQNPLRFLSI